jgi:cell division protein FtsB
MAGAASRTSAPTPPKRMTGRATALCLVLIVLMLAYAYPVRLYLKQEAQIQQLQTAQAAQRARIKSLTEQTIEWNDPAYIKAQARSRFFMVPPGTKTYVVQTPAIPTPAAGTKTASTPWYGQLWSNIRGADDPGAGQ